VEVVLYMEEGKPPFLCSGVGGALYGKDVKIFTGRNPGFDPNACELYLLR